MASFKNLISNTSAQISSGGTITGDLVINGDLQVDGGGSLSFDEIIEGTQVIDVTSTEALLVRKNGDGGDVFKVDTQNTRVGIGSTFSPSYLLHLKSGDNVMASFESTDANASIYLVDSNTTADATFKRVTNDLILLESGGSVGIGGTPDENLHIISTGRTSLRLQGVVTSDGVISDVQFFNSTDSVGAINMNRVSNNDQADMTFHTQPNSGSVTERMRIDSAGNVGIGEDSPAKPLHIKSADNQPVRVESTDAYSGIEFKDNGSATLPPLISALSDDFIFYGGHGSSRPTILTLTSSSQLATFAGDVNISKAGNATLNIKNSSDGLSDEGEIGAIEFEGNDGSANRAGVMSKIVARYSDTGSGDAIDGSANEGGSLGFFTSIATSVGGSQTLAEKMRIENNGNVGIGTSSPGTKLDISSGHLRISTGYELQWNTGATKITGADSYLEFNVNSARRLKLDANSVISLSNNDSGTSNTVLGYGSGVNLDAGSNENVFIGHQASGNGTNNDSLYNVGIGFKSLFDLAGGDGNTAIGHKALFELDEGQFNVSIGKGSLQNLTSGSSNVAIGTDALGNPTTAEDIVAIGRGTAYAVNSDNADGTVAIGRLALQALTSGAGNTSVGYNSSQAVNIGRYNTAFGHQALYSEDVGDRSTAVGWGALYSQNSDTNNEVAGNTGIGMQSGYTNVTGTYNTYVGYNAGYGGGSSSQNVAVGGNSLIAVNGGDNNVAMGYGSAIALTSGGSNVAIGHSAMASATANHENVAIGFEALGDIAVGEGANVAIGYYAMRNVDEGTGGGDANYNIAIGYDALKGGDFASNDRQLQGNVAIGSFALDATSDNAQTGTVAIGYQSLTALTSGAGNTAVGYLSGESITTGVSNTLLGYQAGDGMTVGEDNVAVGHSALGGASTSSENKRNVAVGVGSMSGSNAGASENVAIGYAALDANLTADADGNVAIGYYAGSAITSGEGNTIIGRNAADALATGNKNIAIGRLALSSSQDADNCIAIGYAAMNANNDANSDGTVAIGHAAMNNISTGAGNVGVGFEVMKQVTTGKHNTAVGYQSMYNAMNVGDSNTAMGYQSLYSLDPDTDDHGSNTAVGKQSGYDVSTGTGNVLVGANAGNSGSNDLTTGDNNTYIGNEATGASSSNTNSTVIGATAIGSGSNTVVLGNASVTDVYMAQDSGATVHCANIQFPASQAADSGANVLDDYEEGDWTPVITDGSNDATMNSTFNQGKYTKIGRLVTVSFNCLTSSLGSVSGSISIKGFPFTVGNNYGSGGAGASAGFGNGLAITAGTTVTVSMNLNATTANLQHFDVSTGISALQHSEWTDDGNLKMSLSYMT